MIEVPFLFTINRGDHLYRPFLDVATFLAMSNRSIAAIHRPGAEPEPAIRMACKAAKLDIIIPTGGLLEGLVENETPHSFGIAVVHEMGPRPGYIMRHSPGVWSTQVVIKELRSITTRTISNVFALYAEPFLDARRKLGGVPDTMPVLQFCRMIRNAIFHEGSFNMEPSSPHVASWRGLTYSAANRGEKPLDTDMSTGDLLILTIDLFNEMDHAGMLPASN